MSAAISQKKGWVGARLGDRLDAQDGNHLVFPFRPRRRLPSHCFYKTIDAFSGYLYPQPRYIFPPPLWETSRQRNLQHNQNPP